MCFVLAFLISLLVLICGLQLWQRARKYKKIPGNLGNGIPIFGNLFQCICNYWHSSHPSYHKCLEKNIKKYGDVCCFWLCHKVNIALSDPFIIQKIAFHPSLVDKSYLIFGKIQWFMRNIFSYERSDEEWKLRRKELNNSLKKHSVESYYHEVFISRAHKAVEIFSQASGQFNCMPAVMLLSLETICETHFGFNVCLAYDEALYKDLHCSSVFLASMLTNPILGNILIGISEYIYFPQKQKKFEDMIYKYVMNYTENLNPEQDKKNLPTSASVVLRNVARNTTERELRQELNELLYVGSHTIGTVVASELVFLATNPNVQEKILQEQKDIFGDTKRDPTSDDLQRMKYLERFYKEVLRFTAPPVVVKTATADINIDGMIIPADSVVTISSRHMRFDERYWNKPDEFDPDRFLDENISKVPKCAYAFFGIGIRSCPGAQYANYYSKVMISTIVRNFKIDSTMKFNKISYSEYMMMEINGGYNISVERRL